MWVAYINHTYLRACVFGASRSVVVGRCRAEMSVVLLILKGDISFDFLRNLLLRRVQNMRPFYFDIYGFRYMYFG